VPVVLVEERGLVVEPLLRGVEGPERPWLVPVLEDEVPTSLPVAAPGVPVALVLLPTDPLWPAAELAPGVPIVEVLDPVVLWSVPSVPLAPVVADPL
jgi:hypothetical protein